MTKQNAKFFCENCGSEVPQNAKVCRHCGRFFAAVRCPACGLTGNGDKFKNGCPSCGYAVGKENEKVSPPKEEKPHVSGKSKRNLLNTIRIKRKEFENQEKSPDALPVWIFFVIAAILACLMIAVTKHLGIY